MHKNEIDKAENIMLLVTGGIGRNIMATAVVRAIKKQYPEKKIIVLAGCPDIFLKNPHVSRVLNIGQPSFIYEDYFRDKKTALINVEPYQHFDFLHRTKHLVDCWCEMIGVEPDGVKPDLYFSENEDKMSSLYLQKFDKEMILFQGQGGKTPKDASEKEEIIAKSGMYKRNLPKAIIQEVVDGLIERNYMVGMVCGENQFLPEKAERIRFPIRATLGLIPHVAQIISIDSVLLHGANAFGRKPLAIWGGTNPKVLGYEDNINLTREACPTPMCHRPNSYLWDFEPTGYMWDCPHNDRCMNYSSEKILEEFDKMTGGKNGENREPRREIEPRKEGCGNCNEAHDLSVENEAQRTERAEREPTPEISSDHRTA